MERLDRQSRSGRQASRPGGRRPLVLGPALFVLVALGLYLLLLLNGAATAVAQGSPGRPIPWVTPELSGTPPAAETTEADPTPTPAIVETVLPSPSPTPTNPETPAPAATPLWSPTPTPEPILPVASATSPALWDTAGQWGYEQACTEPLADAENSIDRAFDDAVASCGPFGRRSAWTYTAIEDVTVTIISRVLLEIRFSVSGWSDDPLRLEVNDGTGWETIARFEPGQPPPQALTTLAFDLSGRLSSQAQVNAAQVRLVGTEQGDPDKVVVQMDEVRLKVEGAVAPAPPTFTPRPTREALPSPTPSAIASPTPSMRPSATRLPTEEVPATASVQPTGAISPTAVYTPTVTPLPTGSIPRIQNPVPTPTLPPPAPTDPPQAGDPHAAYAATTASCAGCHRAHTAAGPVLRQAWAEEVVCFSCHGANGPGINVEAAFTRFVNSPTRFFKHDLFATSGVHDQGEEGGAAYGGANRHVECEDCHEPHRSRRGEASPPGLQREMEQASGIDPLWTAPGAPSGFNWLPEAEREYQVCFKCHSSATQLPTYAPDGWNGNGYVANGLPKLTYASPAQVPDSRDMAREFNPYNASFHPVAAPGRNQTLPPGSFVNGWTANSLVYCTDCHSTPDAPGQGTGTHGSPLLHLLTGGANYQTANSGSPRYTGSELCFQCHDANDYTGEGPDTNFRKGSDNLHAKHRGEATCYLCHDTHGSEQLHLINLDVSIENSSQTYFLPGYDGQPTNSQTFWQISPSGTEKTCWIVCHNKDHRDKQYSNYGD